MHLSLIPIPAIFLSAIDSTSIRHPLALTELQSLAATQVPLEYDFTGRGKQWFFSNESALAVTEVVSGT